MGTRRHAVWRRPAEIDLDRRDLSVSNGQHFSVAGTRAVGPADLVHDDCRPVVHDKLVDIEVADPLVGAPTDLEVRLPINTIVERAGEPEVARVSRRPFASACAPPAPSRALCLVGLTFAAIC